jgi:hypothetical protein
VELQEVSVAVMPTMFRAMLRRHVPEESFCVYLRHTRFDLSGNVQAPDVPHLFSPAGFLDDSWWYRTYWFVGTW